MEEKREIPNSFSPRKRRNTAKKQQDKTTFSAFIAPFLTLVLKAFCKCPLSYPAFLCIKRVVLPDITYSPFLLCEMPGIKGTHPLFGFLGIYTTQLIAAGTETWAGEWTCLGWLCEWLAEAGTETLGVKGAQWLLQPTPEQAWAQHTHLSLPNPPRQCLAPAPRSPQPAQTFACCCPCPAGSCPGAAVGYRSSASSGGDTSALISDSQKATAGLTGDPHPNAVEWRHLLWAVISTDSPKAGCHSQPPDS